MASDEDKKNRMEEQQSGVVVVVYGTATTEAEHEEALVALVESRSREVETLRYHLSYYTSQLEEAEKKFRDSESKLARFRARMNAGTSREKVLELENTSNGPIHTSEGSSRNHIAYPSKPQQQQRRLVSAVSSKIAQATRLPVTGNNTSNGSIHRSGGSSRNHIQSEPQQGLVPAVSSKFSQSAACLPVTWNTSNGLIRKSGGSSGNHIQSKPQQRLVPAVSSKFLQFTPHLPVKSEKPQRLSTEKNNIGINGRETKRKFEQKEHEALIPLLCKSSSATSVKHQKSCYILTKNTKRLRSIALCPVNDQRFATSALDGVVNLWEVRSQGSGASLLSTAKCISLERRWPEDIAWHPDGNRLFSVYSADGQDSQISVTNFRVRGEGKADVKFLEDKPHVKSVINNIVFLPWENTSFVTAGNDHAVMLWSENGENNWKPKPLHMNLHSSSVMGVAGMQHKQIVLSAGKDRKIIGYDAHIGIQDFMHQVDSKCLSVLPNPCDFNLFMVQTGNPEQQLRLFDIRSMKTELHAFGWKQSSSETQSALVDQAWSPNGMYITSGSADPVIHIFDIRYNGHKPSQTIQAHRKRVFRAMWLHSVPLLVSISSDLSIGLHKLE